MRKLLLVPVLVISFLNAINAQKGATIYGELLGNGIIYSLNYDFRFDQQKENWGARVGLSYIGESFIFPVQVNYLFGTGTHKLELGGGVLLYSDSGIQTAPCGAIMYRYQKPEGHFVFRAGLAPTFLSISEDDFFSDLDKIYRFWPGVSFGYRF